MPRRKIGGAAIFCFCVLNPYHAAGDKIIDIVCLNRGLKKSIEIHNSKNSNVRKNGDFKKALFYAVSKVFLFYFQAEFLRAKYVQKYGNSYIKHRKEKYRR